MSKVKFVRVRVALRVKAKEAVTLAVERAERVREIGFVRCSFAKRFERRMVRVARSVKELCCEGLIYVFILEIWGRE